MFECDTLDDALLALRRVYNLIPKEYKVMWGMVPTIHNRPKEFLLKGLSLTKTKNDKYKI